MTAEDEEIRSTTMQVRISPREKLAIHRRARVAGLKPSEFVRREALGGAMAARGLAETAAERAVEGRQRGGEQPVTSLAGEITEAKLEPEAAERAFITRRTQELYGQGRTHRVAEAEAKAEWKSRAS